MKQVIQLSTTKCPPCNQLEEWINEKYPDGLEGYQRVSLDTTQLNDFDEATKIAHDKMASMLENRVPFVAFLEDGEIYTTVPGVRGQSQPTRLTFENIVAFFESDPSDEKYPKVPKSKGEIIVRTNFNPDSNDEVDLIKQDFAELINEAEAVMARKMDPESRRLHARTVDHLEDAAMAFVKLLTYNK